MHNIPATCQKCGAQWYSGITLGPNAKNATIVSPHIGAPCPKCGGKLVVESGIYNVVDNALDIIRTEGMTLDKIRSVHALLQQVQGGQIAEVEALDDVGQVDPVFSRFIRTAKDHGVTFDTIVALISLIAAVWIAHSSNADVQAALEEAQMQTELQRQMLEELREQTKSDSVRPTKGQSRSKAQGQTTSPKNPAERRKNATLERRGQSRKKRKGD